MDFKKALEALKAGNKVQLPSWAGDWQKDGDTVKMPCKDGRVLDIRETEDVFYTLANIASDEWEVVGGCNIDLNIHTVRFGEALRLMKQGKSMKREGIEGVICCQNPNFGGPHRGAGMTAPYLYKSDRLGYVPWLPSQRDLFADDWEIVE